MVEFNQKNAIIDFCKIGVPNNPGRTHAPHAQGCVLGPRFDTTPRLVLESIARIDPKSIAWAFKKELYAAVSRKI